MPITFGPARPTIEEADEDEEPTRQGQEIAARAGCMTGAMQDLLGQLFNEQFEKQFKKQFEKQSKQFQKEALRIISRVAAQPWRVSPGRRESARRPLVAGAQRKIDSARPDTADATMNRRLKKRKRRASKTHEQRAKKKAAVANARPSTEELVQKTVLQADLAALPASAPMDQSSAQAVRDRCKKIDRDGASPCKPHPASRNNGGSGPEGAEN